MSTLTIKQQLETREQDWRAVTDALYVSPDTPTRDVCRKIEIIRQNHSDYARDLAALRAENAKLRELLENINAILQSRRTEPIRLSQNCMTLSAPRSPSRR